MFLLCVDKMLEFSRSQVMQMEDDLEKCFDSCTPAGAIVMQNRIPQATETHFVTHIHRSTLGRSHYSPLRLASAVKNAKADDAQRIVSI
jgi:hypothetical protein